MQTSWELGVAAGGGVFSPDSSPTDLHCIHVRDRDRDRGPNNILTSRWLELHIQHHSFLRFEVSVSGKPFELAVRFEADDTTGILLSERRRKVGYESGVAWASGHLHCAYNNHPSLRR